MGTPQMPMKKIDKKALLFWRIHLSAGVFPVPLLAALFLSNAPVWNAVITTLWVAFYLFMFLFYYPVKYKKLAYYINQETLVIYCGVFYNRIKAMDLKNIQRVSAGASPLAQLMKLSTVYISGAGGMVYLPCLSAQEAKNLCAFLGCPAQGGAR